MGVGKTNKRKGSDAERYYAKFFRDLGFTFCETSRFVSKKHDNAKIDLMYLPFNVQVKAGIQKNMNPGKELFLMSSSINTMFPLGDEVFSKPNILIHYKQVGRGFKRDFSHEIVYMSLQQYEKFKIQSPLVEYSSIKEFKFEMDSEYKIIVGMTVEHFKEQVIIKQYIK